MIEGKILAVVFAFVAMIVSFFFSKKWMQIAQKLNLLGEDKQKLNKEKIPEAGGVAVVISAVSALLCYGLATQYFSSMIDFTFIYAISLLLLLACCFGFIDDLVSITRWKKPLLSAIIAVPIMIVCFSQTLLITHIGNFNFGILFPLLIVPAIIIGASNGFNMLAGYNGLEALQGIIIISALGFFSLVLNNFNMFAICLIMVGALTGFYLLNSYPSKLFGGDSLTYPIGAFIGAIAIFAHLELFACVLFIPYFLDALLYIRARFIDKVRDVQAFAKVNEDGSLSLPYNKIYDTTHLAILCLSKIKKKVYEVDVVRFIACIEFALIGVCFFWWWLVI